VLWGRISHFIEKGDELIVARLAFDPKVRHETYERVSFHLASSSTFSKFSPTSPVISHIQQLLNPRRMTHLKDL
jgi:hypothetical protein